MNNAVEYEILSADPAISDFVERFWMMSNQSGSDKEITVIPDGRVDLFFMQSEGEPLQIILLGIETEPSTHVFSHTTLIFGVSLKLLAIEYLLDLNIASLINHYQLLPADFWGITLESLKDFEQFHHSITSFIRNIQVHAIDPRKRKLFELLYSSEGSMSVKALSEKTGWSSRQINRYFNQTFGIALKTYCNILRFKASFHQIKEGNLYPEQNFSDQAHFSREVKKLSGVVPKELSKNKNDRFIQFSTLNKK